MFVVDFITAFLLALAFTIVFDGAVRGRGYYAWRQLPPPIWLLTCGTWIGGMGLVAFGAFAGRWVPFALAIASLALLVFALLRARLRDRVRFESEEAGNDARPAIALYFFVTLLLFFCAISLRFYIVHLS